MEPPKLSYLELNGVRIAEVIGGGVVVNAPQDALEIVGNASYAGASGVLLEARQLAPAFFDLRSGLAGEVLQKFINFQLRVAVVGHVHDASSTSWSAFTHESNRGSSVAFLPDRASAIAWFGGS